MAVSVTNVTTQTPTFTFGTSWTTTVSYTLNAASTNIVVVIHGTSTNVTSITWGGAALTSRASSADGNVGRVSIWDRDAPATGTANIVITSSVNFTGLGVTIFGLSGVDSGTPRRGTNTTAGSFSATATLSVTTTSGDFVLGGATTVNVPTLSSGTAINTGFLALSEYGSVASKVATGVSTSLTWTQTAEWQGVALVAYIPGATPPVPTDVDTDESITADQQNVVVTGTTFGASQGAGSVKIEQGAVIVTQTIDSWSDTSIQFDTVQGGLKYGTSTTLRVTANSGENGTITITFTPPSTRTYINASGYPAGGGALVLGSGASPSIVDGDQFEYDTASSSGSTVTVFADGTYMLSDARPASFQYRVWDGTDSTWSSRATVYANMSAASSGATRSAIRSHIRSVIGAVP